MKLWDVAAGKEQATLPEHKAWVTSVAFAADGNTLATASGDAKNPVGEIHLWDVATKKERAALKGFVGSVMSLDISPDGKTLAAGTYQGMLKLWALETGEELVVLQGHDPATFKGHKGPVSAAAVSPDGQTLATGGVDQTVKLWDLATGQLRSTLLEGQSAGVSCLAFSPDGKTLAIGTGGSLIKPKPGEVKLWDVSARQVRVALKGYSTPVNSLTFSLDGKILAVGSGNTNDLSPGEVKLWHADTGEFITTIQSQFAVGSVAIAPDGKRLAMADGNLLKLWDLADRELKWSIGAHQGRIRSLAFAPDGKTLVTAGDDKAVKLWQAATGLALITLQGHINSNVMFVSAVAFSPDGKTLATGAIGRQAVSELRLWHAATEKETAIADRK